MDPIRTTPPAVEPVTLAMAKMHAKVDQDFEDDLITQAISAARETCENRVQRTLINTGWTWALDTFPPCGNVLYIPMPPLVSVTAVQYVDPDGVTRTMAPEALYTDLLSSPARLAPASGAWPATARRINAVSITYTAGYGAAPANVPPPLARWILLAVAHMIKERTLDNEVRSVPDDFAIGLLQPYCIHSL